MKIRHTDRDTGGRYRSSELCDACGKPVGTEYLTDDEVCGGGDGPGFFLCSRVRCCNKRDPLTVDQRRALYTERRALNQAG